MRRIFLSRGVLREIMGIIMETFERSRENTITYVWYYAQVCE